jgi:hypothetical protein
MKREGAVIARLFHSGTGAWCKLSFTSRALPIRKCRDALPGKAYQECGIGTDAAALPAKMLQSSFTIRFPFRR